MASRDFDSLIEATSGVVGGVLSTTLLYPLDTCKTRFQAESKYHGDGRKYRSPVDVLQEALSSGKLLSLYRGLGAKNVQSALASFVYFYSYSMFKKKYIASTGRDKLGMTANLLVATAAGACTVIATHPLDTVAARLQTSEHGESDTSGSLSSFQSPFDGLGVSLILTSNPAIQYTVFEQLRNWWLQRKLAPSKQGSIPKDEALSAFAAFMIGALAKCAATILTYPLIRCKIIMQRALTEEEVRMKRAGHRQSGPPQSIVQALRIIWSREGVTGFFKGLEAQLMKTVIAAALMLMVKEKVGEASRAVVLASMALMNTSHVMHDEGVELCSSYDDASV